MGGKVFSSPETGLILSENLFAGQLATLCFLDLFKQSRWLPFQNDCEKTLSVEKPPGCPNSIESLQGTVRSELTRATATKIKQRDCCFLVVKRSTICRLYQGRALPLRLKWMIVSPPEIRLLNIV